MTFTGFCELKLGVTSRLSPHFYMFLTFHFGLDVVVYLRRISISLSFCNIATTASRYSVSEPCRSPK